MPRLSYRETVKVYHVTSTETSPPHYALMAEQVPVLIRELGAGSAMAESAAFGANAHQPLSITHRGRCEYNALVTERPEAALLVSEADGRQYLVARVRYGPAVRGGHSWEMYLSLEEQYPLRTNLGLE
jgi:hypothetical protein